MKKGVIIAVVAIIVAVGGGYYLLTQNKTEETKESPSTSTQQSSQTSSTKAAIVDDACGVFTLSELSDGLSVSPLATGKPGSASKTSDNLPLVQCEWEQGSGGPSDYTLHLDVYNFASSDKATSDMNNSNVSGGSLSSEVVDGVADQALFARSGSGTPVQAMLYWRKDSVVYHLSAVRLDGVDRPAMEAKLKALVQAKF